MSNGKVLIVEGEQEKFFFKTLLDKKLSLKHINIQVFKPSDLGCTGNGFGNLLKSIPEELDRIEKGETTHLAFVADADDNFSNQLLQVSQKLSEKDFLRQPHCNNGEIFTHKSGKLNSVGLWLMPNHQDTGAIEKLFIDACSEEQRSCLNLALGVLAPHPCSNNLNDRWLDKAKIYTWLAWQEKPTFGYGDMYKRLDAQHPWMAGLEQWLQEIYA
ncbi:MAG: DUF3226 domain-containing protein [Halothiobacillaceae bacterium]